MVILRADPAELRPGFLYYVLKSTGTRAQISTLQTGVAQPQFPIRDIKKLRIPIPDATEQDKIIDIVKPYEDLVANNRRRIELLEHSARLLYREWFVRLKYPGHEHDSIIDGVPEGWARRPLGEICTLRAGDVFKPGFQGERTGDYPFIKVRDMNSPGNLIAITEADNWVSEGVRESQRLKPFPPRTSVFAKIGEALRQNRVRHLVMETVIDNNMMGAIPKSGIDGAFLFCVLSNYDIASHASGAAVPFLTAGVLSAIPILVPDAIVMNAFSDLLTPILEGITTLQRQSTKATQARDLLLPRLMDGSLRMKYNEDTLVQETTANYLRDQLGWESVYAYNEERFGREGTLGRKDETEVVLTRYLGEALIKLNPGLPQEAYQAAIREITQPTISQSPLHANREKYNLLRDGVLVPYRDEKGALKKARLRVFDFQKPEANHFLCVRELWIKGDLYRRRADIIGFVNGLPLLFMELKNVHRDLRRAHEGNLSDYKDTIPHLFEHNAVIILGNGTTAKIGSVSSRYKHFREWKRLAEDEPGAVDMETLLKGVCSKANFVDLFENFILFDESKETLLKIVAQNQQFLGVNLAIDAVRNRESLGGKLGVFWHTQGAGKSYSIVFFARKVHRHIGGNFTFLVLTDREDLDGQIYGTFAGCGVVNNDKDPCRAGSGAELKAMLAEAHKHFVFSLIQKFNQPVTPENPYSTRNDIIVITDEAHRTQYGRLSLNMRNALPNASYIGFTGTPLFSSDQITRRVFGNYVSRYGFQRAVEDEATVPLYYDARGEKLGVAVNDLNERIAAKLEELEQNGELEDINVTERLEKELKRDYHVITAGPRLEKIAKDFVDHYSAEWESGETMFVAIDKITTVRMHQLIEKYWKEKIEELRKATALVSDEQELAAARRRIGWMEETTIAVVISEEQGEVKKFRHWDIDIEPYRKLLKTGFPDVGGKSLSVEDAFKKEGHPFRVAIVCAMWLTGFDVPCLGTLYLDKPLQAHTLMQAIARANRVHEGKNNGLIVDYCGILKNLRKALATFAGSKGGEDDGEVNPLQPSEDLLPALASAIGLVYDFLREKGAELEAVINSSGFERNAAIDRAKNAINENDEMRKRFEIMAREVFSKFKACITLPAINDYRAAEGAISIIYKSLQEDRDAADISHIIQQLHSVIEPAIVVKPESLGGGRLYDISAIDFDLLRREFERLPNKQTAVHNLKDAIEKRLARMLAQNPLRTNFQKRYEEIVAEYNGEKDRVTIETTFEALMRFMGNLDEEAESTIREGLNEETKALFDLLKKKDLEKKDIDRIKKVAVELHAILLRKKAEIDEWRAKEQTRDEVRTTIRDFLYDDSTGLPEIYTDQEVVEKTDAVFAWAYRAYA